MAEQSDSMGRIVVRTAGEEDRQAVRELTRRAYQEFADVMDPTSWDGLRKAIEGGLANYRRAEVIVLERDRSLVGSVMLFSPEAAPYGAAVAGVPWPEIRLLAVDPSARGEGIAAELIAACLRRVREQGHRGVGLHTSRSMKIAIELYRRMGFVRVPEFDFQPPGAERVEAYYLALPNEPTE